MTSTINTTPLLQNLTTIPKCGSSNLSRWCDYIEIRCLTHKDKRFSVDNLAEAIYEAKDIANPFDDDDDDGLGDLGVEVVSDVMDSGIDDKSRALAATCFGKLKIRSELFESSWPFTLDESTKEIYFVADLSKKHNLYIQLLMSSLLSYCHQRRWKDLTGKFERISYELFRCLMPGGSEVHAFGAAESQRYTGHLYERLKKLAEDIRGNLLVSREDFAPTDSGDGGLDLVAWHPLDDTRQGIPISMAQCGCTADGWPNKLHQASPDSLRPNLTTLHPWSTYYFMPLDLSKIATHGLHWEKFSDFSSVIMIDRLRFIRLAESYDLWEADLYDEAAVSEIVSMELT